MRCLWRCRPGRHLLHPLWARAAAGRERPVEGGAGWCIAPALAGIVAVGVVGAGQYEWFQESDGVSFYVFAWVLFAAPFLGISGFYLAGIIGKTAVILGTLAGLAALEVVPLLVDRSIEDDPSSTAGLIHLWDPFLNSFVVSCAVALGVGLEALARAMDHDT